MSSDSTSQNEDCPEIDEPLQATEEDASLEDVQPTLTSSGPTTRSSPTPRPTSSCPDCQRPGRPDADQMTGSTGRAYAKGTRLLTDQIRFSCECGAKWLCGANQAYEQGEWLARVGLYGLLSPPAHAGLIVPPPGIRRYGKRLKTVRDHKKARPPKGTGQSNGAAGS